MKSESQHFYHIYNSLSKQLSWKKSLLLTCQIFGPLLNTLAADDKYPVVNRDKLMILIQMQLSHKQKHFPQFLFPFLEFRLNFEYFEKKMTFIDFVFPKLRTAKTWLDKFLKSLVSEDLWTNNIVNGSKHC